MSEKLIINPNTPTVTLEKIETAWRLTMLIICRNSKPYSAAEKFRCNFKTTMGLDFRTVFDHILNISVIDWVEYLSQWFIAEYSVIAYLWNISISLFSLRSWALLSLMVWLRACSDNRSAYSLWENLAPCSTMDDSVSCCEKKVQQGYYLPLSSYVTRLHIFSDIR